ncbi:histone acetyltransferase 1 [Yamadazyma tenuis]|uniref:Histone acetyltransferase type B catalytic subunit n=1 Tax=Candida tenuis (strain ATCC 10573 / BCRC 21748 / CBS 615 / JCM 9827 / NBRC 10315 / NRRL Y-1498 / VKM Y-70) TaxID=590646 RepID=G3B9J4_CANTC|nr:histone acetyltransferase type B catalytic subunit [Yamadazyma tenuis ATCC 10573]EGV61903.1 histone acetyltransferase type B catalytic subunit [Yamadazyma tenuis ATCC 10573]WEJ93137.1 histone acetyltransferase 1 [Yamadazyma tenuis]
MTDLTEALKPELWTVSSNEALKLFVAEPNGTAINFKPAFTYPVFGDSESIFGFKNLVIFLCFDHYTFYPFLNVKYDTKLNDEVEEPKDTIMKFLPESTVFKDEIKWVDAIKNEKETYSIPGTIVGGFESFAIYKIDMKQAAAVELHKRLQILVLLYIEAGSFIDHKDELWDLYVIYDTPNDPEDEPSIVGFVTAYNYWKYPGASNFDAGIKQSRKKISQFVILPNFQGQSIGSKTYSALYDLWLKDDQIVEIVVEDPNEHFDDMRDKSDLNRLKSVINLKDINLTKVKSEAWLETFRVEQKLEKRQFNRLVEMILLSNFKTFKNLSYKNIRLFIKQRLYNKNKEALLSLEKPVRLDKLQTAYQTLEEDYYRILNGLNLYPKRPIEEEANSSKRIKV